MKKNKRWVVLDKLGWIAFSIVVLYFLLKILGVIHSPLTLDVTALISGAFFVGKYAMKIDYLSKDVSNLKKEMRIVKEKCPHFE